MMPAPTKEIAIGMNTRALKIFSPRERSMKTAYRRPTRVEIVGTQTTQMMVLTTVRTASSCVKIHTKLSSPTRSPALLLKARRLVRIAG
jgi:hypothetical protein